MATITRNMLSQTELGKQFGMTSTKFGELLKQNHLRNLDGDPSGLADGMYEIDTTRGRRFYWDAEMVIGFLESRGIVPTYTRDEVLLNEKLEALVKQYVSNRTLDGDRFGPGHVTFDAMGVDIVEVGVERFNRRIQEKGFDAIVW